MTVSVIQVCGARRGAPGLVARRPARLVGMAKTRSGHVARHQGAGFAQQHVAEGAAEAAHAGERAHADGHGQHHEQESRARTRAFPARRCGWPRAREAAGSLADHQAVAQYDAAVGARRPATARGSPAPAWCPARGSAPAAGRARLGRWRYPGCRWAHRPAGWAGAGRRRAPGPRAAARRRKAAPGNDRTGPPVPRGPAVRGARSRPPAALPASSMGSSTFSSAVSVGIRW